MPIALSLNLSIGRSCFVRCRGCYNHFGKQADEIDNESVLRFLALAFDRGFRKVTLSGGDPLSRSHLPELLDSIKSIGMQINLDTVGTSILGATKTIFFGAKHVEKADLSRIARAVDSFGVPLDGSDEASVSAFRRGRAKIHDEQIRILAALDRAGAAICVNTVVHRKNLEKVVPIASQICEFANVRVWQLFEFMPIGPMAYRNRAEFEITDFEFNDLVAKVLDTAKFFTTNVSIQPKSKASRKGNYLLIDSDGIAWTPSSSSGQHWDDKLDSTRSRFVVGNIKNVHEHEHILNFAMLPDMSFQANN